METRSNISNSEQSDQIINEQDKLIFKDSMKDVTGSQYDF